MKPTSSSSSEILYINEFNPYPITESPSPLVGINHKKVANEVWQADAQQVVLIMVGLPARGKSLISGKGLFNSC